MIRYTQKNKKPQQWLVEHEGRRGIVGKSPVGVARCRRWYLLIGRDETHRFSSRRAAFRYFETGVKFAVTPVYSRSGRNKGARLR